MAYWNHFERHLSRRDGDYFVNGEHRLMFYHFSGYSPEKPDAIIKQTRSHVMSFSERPDLRPIFDEYRRRLLARGYASFKVLKYSLRQNIPPSGMLTSKGLKNGIQKFLRALPLKLQSVLVRAAQFTINSFKK